MLDKRLKTYFDGAQIHVRAHGQAYVIEDKNSAEADAWLQYFESVVGKIPVTYVTFLNGHAKCATVPSQWPNQFDASAEAYKPRPKPAKQYFPRPSLQEMYAKYGRTFGLTPEEEPPVKQAPRPITADDFEVSPYLTEMMRARLGRREAA